MVEVEFKVCSNCGEVHFGFYDECKTCYNSETDAEYEARSIEAKGNLKIETVNL
ncbi:hypothetical protein [Paenibacillus cremeus]|uniref:hypothetical protein n=1 Tax=Paenibacillus cremeus TaxID=2163881 RepID=UPI00164651B9|nr:hypothetical protein [Paenibacillus cremeus]